MNEIWVLTSEYNDYDQHGQYFECAWVGKPDVRQLKEVSSLKDEGLSTLTHLLKGGGRRNNEYRWYNLFLQGQETS